MKISKTKITQIFLQGTYFFFIKSRTGGLLPKVSKLQVKIKNVLYFNIY